MNKYKSFFICLITLLLFSYNYAAPSANLWNYWNTSNPNSTKTIDFSKWQDFLNKYTFKQNNQVYVRYASVTQKDKHNLNDIIKNYSTINILKYNRDQQLAYWINLYNMLTIQTILKHYPVKSITDIDKGWFGTKVWDQKVITVDNKPITLNDIEHRIIRPIWKDPRTHSALNCASISCPNLSQTAFTGDKINQQLNLTFSNWINSSKGLEIKDNDIYLSKIFYWYGTDFGDKAQMINFIKKYIKNKNLKAKLTSNSTIYFQNYDWNLNTKT